MYRSKRRTKMHPHVFAVSDGAYSDMLNSKHLLHFYSCVFYRIYAYCISIILMDVPKKYAMHLPTVVSNHCRYNFENWDWFSFLFQIVRINPCLSRKFSSKDLLCKREYGKNLNWVSNGSGFGFEFNCHSITIFVWI